MTREDAIKVLKGAGIAAVGAVLTYLTQWISGHDFGSIRKFIIPTN